MSMDSTNEVINSPLIEAFKTLDDPRVDRQKHHLLIDILIITVCAVICGANQWTEIEEFGLTKKAWLKSFLKLPNGIPSHDTINRVFRLICPERFQECFINWITTIGFMTNNKIIPIDGKTLKGSYDKKSSKLAIHMVHAWSTENNVLLGQIKTEEKSNEITAIPKLLDLLVIEGCIITIDAMGCQKEIAEKIISKDGDYILALKENHPTLYKKVASYFDERIFTKKEKIQKDANNYYSEIDTGHGRKELREYWLSVVEAPLFTKEISQWANLQVIGTVRRTREYKGKTSVEIHYYVGSINNDVKLFAESVRKHWQVENNLHWQLDVAFKEDTNRTRIGYAQENLAMARRIALNCLQNETTIKKGIPTKRLKAGWDLNYLKKVINVLHS